MTYARVLFAYVGNVSCVDRITFTMILLDSYIFDIGSIYLTSLDSLFNQNSFWLLKSKFFIVIVVDIEINFFISLNGNNKWFDTIDNHMWPLFDETTLFIRRCLQRFINRYSEMYGSHNTLVPK